MSRIMFTVIAAAALTGCATIVGSSTQTIPISSTPGEAQVVIVDEAGVTVFAGLTPTSATLNKSTFRYWGKKSFTVTISKPGFRPQVIPITASANGWYLAGNIVFGGLVGWFAVDPLGGEMYTLSPKTIAASLPADAARNSVSRDGGVTILLLEDVPAHLRNQLVKVQVKQ